MENILEKVHYKRIELAHKIYIKLYTNFRKPVKLIKGRKIGAKLNISHVTIYSTGNAGDTVLSTAMRDLFNTSFGSISWNIKKVTATINQRYIDSLNKTDAIIIGGHGLFLPDTNPNDISNWEFACSEEYYDEITKPIIVFAVGYNYFKGQERSLLFESNVRKLVEKSAFFGLRNQGSVREIQSFLDDSLKKKVVYQPCPTMIARYLYPDLPPKKGTGKIAFNLALDRAKLRMADKIDEILGQIALAMRRISEKGYDVYFITHMATEIPFLRYLEKQHVRFSFKDASTWDAKKLMLFYNSMDVVIGMRGHGIWIPFGVNCQIISLGNQNKTKWFLEDIDALDWFIDITEEPEKLAEQIVKKFVEIHEEKDAETDQRLIEAQKTLWEITCQNMKRIEQAIGGGMNVQ